jgi:hypothetical protein
VGQLYLRRHGVEINNKNTVRNFAKSVLKSVVKRRKEKNGFNAGRRLRRRFS